MVREQLHYYEETNVKNIFFFLGTNNKKTKLTEEGNNGK
jgi:hypothetical protein